jgi:hypothetical protein
MTKSTRLKDWRKLLRFLRTKFPISVPVIVKRIKMIKNDGITNFNGSQFHIYIASNNDYNVQAHSLIHEYSHAKVIDEAYQHKGKWGEVHAEIYEAWEKWDNEE